MHYLLNPLEPLDEAYLGFAQMVCTMTGDDSFPIQRLGSGIVIAFEGEFYLVTARHVFVNNRGNPNGVVVPLVKEGSAWWSTDACYHLGAAEKFENENTYADLAIYSLHTTDKTRGLINGHMYMGLPPDSDIEVTGALFAIGYPDSESDMDIDHKIVSSTKMVFQGEYDGPLRNSLAIHRFKCPEGTKMNMNGMSGGPITTPDYTQLGRHILVGMILQASGDGLIHFVEARMIRYALLDSIDRLRELRVKGPFSESTDPI